MLDLVDIVKQCTGYEVADFEDMLDSMLFLHRQKECFPLAVRQAEIEEKADADYYQPQYPDFATFLTSKDNVPIHEDLDAELVCFGVL